MIDWSRSYTVDWRVVKVNPDTWDDGELVSGVVSVTVNRDMSDAVPLLETSSFVIDAKPTDTFEEGWYRAVAYVSQDGKVERYPITTQLLQNVKDTVDYGVAQATFDGGSSLLPVSEVMMENGGYVPKGVSGPDWAFDMLKKNTAAPVRKSPGDFSLDQYVVYDSNSSVLQAVWDVVLAGGWCLIVDGSGVVWVTPKPDQPSLVLDSIGVGHLHPKIDRNLSFKGVPNKYIARDGSWEEIAENRDINSKLSYERRKRWVTVVDDNPVYINGESLWSYARRKLEEASTQFREYSYTREFADNVYPFSLVRASVPNQGIDGDLRVRTQQITLDQGITVQETAVKEIKGWVNR